MINMADSYKFKKYPGLQERLNDWIANKRRNMSVQEVAELMGYKTASTISKFPDRKSIAKEAIRRICRDGEHTLEWFLHGGAGTAGSSSSHASAFRKRLVTAERARSHEGVIINLEKERDPLPHLKFETKEQHRLMSRTLGGITFKIPCVMVSKTERIKLGHLDTVNRAMPDAGNDPFVVNKKMMVKSIPLENNLIYTAKHLENDELSSVCKIEGGLSDYFTFLKLHASMEIDFLESIERGNPRAPTKRDEFLDEANAQTPVAIGISTLLVYADKETKRYKALVLKRSDEPAFYPGLRSIIPGGIFQPEFTYNNPLVEWNICYSIIKEYSEELFKEIVPENTHWQASKIFTYWDSARILRDALLQGKCKLIHSGVVLNLLNLSLEICTVLLIESSDWFNEQRFNWGVEYVPRDKLKAAYGAKGVVTDYDLRDFEGEFTMEFRESHKTPTAFAGEWASDSLATLWLGIDATIEYLDGKRSAIAVDGLLPDWALPTGQI
jgi:hypothetical protein